MPSYFILVIRWRRLYSHMHCTQAELGAQEHRHRHRGTGTDTGTGHRAQAWGGTELQEPEHQAWGAR
jgi:hypothetical protein